MAAPTQTFVLPFWKEFRVSVALFSDVTNAKDIKQLAMNGEINVALIKTQMVVDIFQILSAATKALHVNDAGKLITKTLHSEILYSLSPTKNISDCFKKFGLDNSDKSLLIAEIHKDQESKLTEVCSKVKGEQIPLSRLKEFTDTAMVHKVYKVKDAELSVGTLLESVIARMASKDFITY